MEEWLGGSPHLGPGPCRILTPARLLQVTTVELATAPMGWNPLAL